MKSQIKREFILVLIGSLIIAICFSSVWKFPVKLILITTFLINFSLMFCMWYSEYNRRPLIFQGMVILYLGITIYCLIDTEEIKVLGRTYNGSLMSQLCLLLLAGVILVTLSGIKGLKKMTGDRIDSWIPPLWPIVFAGTASFIADKDMTTETLRIGIIIAMCGLIAATAYKNNSMENKSVAYKISTKNYIMQMLLFGVVIFSINQMLPKVNELPGTQVLKEITHNWGKGLAGDVEAKSELNRNPSQSEELVAKVQNVGPVYLRKMSYSYYNNGTWRIKKGDNLLKPLRKKDLYQMYDLFEFLVEGLSEGDAMDDELLEKYKDALNMPKYEVKEKTAYIEEIEDIGFYFSVNGFNNIEIAGNSQIGYYQNINNIYFANINEQDDISYTVNYKKYKPSPGTREYAMLYNMNREDFKTLMSKVNVASLNTQEDMQKVQQLTLEYDNYDEIYDEYTQVPEDVAKALTKASEAINVRTDGDWEKAEIICDIFKSSGRYTYELNAPYTHNDVDPIIDFIFAGKKGICQDFATAMTLLCRRCGLPARYVVGYYSIERSDEDPGSYNVRVKDGHAFVEVYISGYGWMLFDPTPVREAIPQDGDIAYDSPINENGLKFDLRDTATVFAVFIFIILAILFFMFPFKWIKNIAWKWYLLNIPAKKSIISIMNHTIRLLEDRNIVIENSETVSDLAVRLWKNNIDITPITKAYEAYYYGKKTLNQSDIESAIECYHKLSKTKKITV